MKKAEVTIGEMEIKIAVIAFALKVFKREQIAEIMHFISENPFSDDLTDTEILQNRGQITVDELLGIIYTGSAEAARYIAQAYRRKSLSKKHQITVYRRPVTVALKDELVTLTEKAGTKPKKKRSRKKPQMPAHNLQPVLDAMQKEATVNC